MRALTALYIFAATTFGLAVAAAIFNYTVDPQCFYHCDTLDPERPTFNPYYQVAQRIASHPETEQIVLGSSRGETISPLFLKEITGLATMNLSVGGAEARTKLTFLKIASEHMKLKRVIWFADYFDLIPKVTEAKLMNCPYLRQYIPEELQEGGASAVTDHLLSLIDHKTLEASFYSLKRHEPAAQNLGSGSDIDFQACGSADFKGKETESSLAKEVDLLYQSYTHNIFTSKQSAETFSMMRASLQEYTAKGIEIVVFITPYHPDFLSRLKEDYPEYYKQHLEWVALLNTLKEDNIRIVDYFAGLPQNEKTPSYWNDGVHFTCKGAQEMVLDSGLGAKN